MDVYIIVLVWNDELSVNTQDSQASHDFIHYDSDPTPDVNDDEPNSHGTECAGVVGMKRNSVCGVGVAYNASIGCESAESFKRGDTCTLPCHITPIYLPQGDYLIAC